MGYLLIGLDAVRFETSGSDLKVRDLSTLEAEVVSQVERNSGKVAGQPTRNDVSPVLLLQRVGLAGIRVLGRRRGLPCPDGFETRVGSTLVLDDGLSREAARHGFAVSPVGVEVVGDRFGKTELGHGDLLH